MELTNPMLYSPFEKLTDSQLLKQLSEFEETKISCRV